MSLHLPPILTSSLDYELPEFDRFDVAVLRTELEQAFKNALAAIDDIARNPEPATFANTVAPLEDTRVVVSRLVMYLFNLAATETNDELRAAEEWAFEALARHTSAIGAHKELAARVNAVLHDERFAQLPEDCRRLTEKAALDMKLAGSLLEGDALARLQEIDARLSNLQANFSKKILAGLNDAALHITEESKLAGLPQDQKDAAETAAKAKDLPGWLLTLDLPTMQPALASLTDRRVREELFWSSRNRGKSGEHATSEQILEIVKLRAERAALLGFEHFAACSLASQTAPNEPAVRKMLQSMIEPAVVNAQETATKLAAAAAQDGVADFAAWDWTFYAAQDTSGDNSFDEEAAKPYFELHNVIHEGLFRAASLLYGVTFTERKDLPGYADDVMVFEVRDHNDDGVGLILMDWYARETKRGGAWMSSFIDQSLRVDTKPITTCNLNIRKPAPGKPTLLTFDEVNTAFHELGHVLHGMMSKVEFWSQSGTSVPRDFVEFPSQVNEMWAIHPEILPHYAKHCESGAVMSVELQEKVRAAGSVVFARNTVEMIAAAILDWEWHCLSVEQAAAITDVAEFERDVFARWGIPVDVIPARYASNYFMHIFEGGYSAGYYSYVWSEVLDADLVKWFYQSDDLAASGAAFRDLILSIGGSKDPLVAFEELVGRAPDTQPLLERYQLV